MRVYVVRHGHKANQQSEYDGGYNTPLSDRGRQQAECVADFLGDRGIDHLYSSVQLRALETAAAVHESVGSEWHVWPVFCEMPAAKYGNGTDDETGLEAEAWPTGTDIQEPTRDDLEAKHGHYYRLSDVPDRFPGVTLSQPFPWPEAWWVPLRTQTYWTGIARVELGTRALLDRHEGEDRIAVICHNRTGSTLVSSLLGVDRDHAFPFPFDLAGITRVDRDADDVWRVKYANKTGHLGPDFQSRFD